MSNAFTRNLGQPTPQVQPVDSTQKQNNAGGYTFTISDEQRLTRFLVLGVDGGSYYVDEQKLTKDNTSFLRLLIERDEELVTRVVREVSSSGRAYRNSAAIFAVASLFQYGKMKNRALLRDVCRTSTHLFEFAEYVELLGGWSRSKRDAVAQWYTTKNAESLAYQLVKYRQRNGWTHLDLLRLSHPTGLNSDLFNFAAGNPIEGGDDTPPILRGFRLVQSQTDVKYVLNNLDLYRELPWEALPTQFLKNPEVWKKLFYNGNLNGQALVRNITRLSRIGAFKDMVFARDYATRLIDVEMIERTRLHPIQYLLAHSVHVDGQIDRAHTSFYASSYRKRDWDVNSTIVDALNDGFYAAFKYVEPANKRTLVAIDVSGSMSHSVCGIDLTAAQMAAAMAMTIAKTEPFYQVMGFASQYTNLGIAPSMSLTEVMRRTSMHNFGNTDCSLPITHAMKNGIEVDTFVVITDNETWAGNIHPHIALQQYRKRFNIDAKLIVVATTPTEFSIANPTDAGMLDVVGADTNLPRLITEFSAGRI